MWIVGVQTKNSSDIFENVVREPTCSGDWVTMEQRTPGDDRSTVLKFPVVNLTGLSYTFVEEDEDED